MDKDTLQEIAKIWDKIGEIERKQSGFTESRADSLKADIDYVAIMTDTYVDESEESEE